MKGVAECRGVAECGAGGGGGGRRHGTTRGVAEQGSTSVL